MTSRCVGRHTVTTPRRGAAMVNGGGMARGPSPGLSGGPAHTGRQHTLRRRSLCAPLRPAALRASSSHRAALEARAPRASRSLDSPPAASLGRHHAHRGGATHGGWRAPSALHPAGLPAPRWRAPAWRCCPCCRAVTTAKHTGHKERVSRATEKERERGSRERERERPGWQS